MKSALGTNVLPPIVPNPSFILDIGAGSGRWAIEVAEEYPQTQVLGLDLSPIHPPYVPENCKFLLGDLNKDLLSKFDEGQFDFVHSRYVIRFRVCYLGYICLR